MCQVHFMALFLVSDEQSQNAESGDGGGDGDLSQGATESLNDTKGTFPRLRIISFSHFGLSNSSLDVRFLALFLVSDEQSHNAESGDGGGDGDLSQGATESLNDTKGTFPRLKIISFSHFGLSNSSLDVRFLALFLVSDEQSQNAEMEPQHSQDPEDGHDDEAEAENVDMGMFPGLET